MSLTLSLDILTFQFRSITVATRMPGLGAVLYFILISFFYSLLYQDLCLLFETSPLVFPYGVFELKFI